jgi:asparagine synthase (glutamine-hydrolysing)
MAIFGVAAGPGSRPVQTHELKAMRSSLTSGTNGGGGFCVPPWVGLGSVSPIGSGSFWSSDAVLVACDAEVYNAAELRSMVTATSPSDTAELIATLYLEQGPLFIQRLRGVFSLAIWDQTNRTLMLAVDRFGVKRLCYATNDSEIIFATQPRGIFASRRMTKKVSLAAITDYLAYNVVPSPRTAFEGVGKVAPGEYLLWKVKEARTNRYWEMRYSEDARESSKVLAGELLSRMEEAVRITSADLDPSRTGCFLSGGTDSSSVVGLLTQIKKCSTNAFSVGFTEKGFNELEYARIAAKQFRAHHFESSLGPAETYETIPKIVAGYDEPFGNSSALPTYWCAKLARDHGIEVLLAGDGGDELFGGNERYRVNQIFDIYQNIPRLVRQRIIEPLVFGNPFKFGIFGKMQRYIRHSNTGNPERYCQWRLLRAFSPEQVLGAEMPFRNGNGDLLEIIRMHYKLAPATSELNRLLYVDVKMTLGDDDLPKVARTAELAGVNVRFPYLDHELAEFSGRVPARLKVHYLEKRYLFKQATRKLLPAAILRKKKHGFGLPIGVWLRTDPKLHTWVRDVFSDPRTYQRGYFRRDFIEQLFVNMQQDNTPYFGDLLWTFLMLELWHRRHVEGSAC